MDDFIAEIVCKWAISPSFFHLLGVQQVAGLYTGTKYNEQ